MQFVIDIPYGLKDAFEHEEQWTDLICATMRNALRKSTPLPENHGNLIDADAFRLYAFRKNFERRLSDEGLSYLNLYLDMQPIILEGDKEVENAASN